MVRSRSSRSVWTISLRRLFALLAMAGIAFASVERVFPDVHDGDSDSVAAHVQAADDAAAPDQGSASGPEQQAPHRGSGAPSPEPASHHGLHVDHCGHAHGMACGGPRDIGATAAPTHDRIDTASRRPASVSLPPHRRPPIA